MTKLTKAQKAGPWTRFHDMHSGGGQKLDWGHIFIQAPREEAIEIFKKTFSRDPDHVTCDCCGPDYSISENRIYSGDRQEQRFGDLGYATCYERNADFDEAEMGNDVFSQGGNYKDRRLFSLEEYVSTGKAKFLFKRMVKKLVPEYGDLP